MRTGLIQLAQQGWPFEAAFRRGQTQPYSPAIRLYLFVSLVFFVLLSVTNIAIVQFEIKATPQKVVWQNGQPFAVSDAPDRACATCAERAGDACAPVRAGIATHAVIAASAPAARARILVFIALLPWSRAT